jgi:hypothetical protein
MKTRLSRLFLLAKLRRPEKLYANIAEGMSRTF